MQTQTNTLKHIPTHKTHTSTINALSTTYKNKHNADKHKHKQYTLTKTSNTQKHITTKQQQRHICKSKHTRTKTHNNKQQTIKIT